MKKRELSTISYEAMRNNIFKTIILLFLCLLVFMPANTCSAKSKEIIKLNKTRLTLTPGKSYSFKVTLYGGSGSIKWSSSNRSVATVKNGTVTAKKAGSATIKAKYSGKTAQCRITVKNPNKNKKKIYGVFCNHVKSINKKNGKITIKSDEIRYFVGETLSQKKQKTLSTKCASKVKYAEYTYGNNGKDKLVKKLTFKQLKQYLYYNVEDDDYSPGIMKIYVVGGKIKEIRVFCS